MHPVLKLDAAGTPRQWISVEQAAHYVAKGQMIWHLGDNLQTLHGGINRAGCRSALEVPSIIAVEGLVMGIQRTGRLPVHKSYLLKRDRHICAYCGDLHAKENLQMEHIHPQARGGKTTWTNIVSACSGCNSRKGCRTPEEAHMPLLYVPYVPNLYEGLILQGRKILADQMDYLMAGVPAHSRLLG